MKKKLHFGIILVVLAVLITLFHPSCFNNDVVCIIITAALNVLRTICFFGGIILIILNYYKIVKREQL